MHVDNLAVQIILAALALHAVYLVLKTLWKHRDPLAGAHGPRRWTLSLFSISYQEEPATPAEKPQKTRQSPGDILRLKG